MSTGAALQQHELQLEGSRWRHLAYSYGISGIETSRAFT